MALKKMTKLEAEHDVKNASKLKSDFTDDSAPAFDLSKLVFAENKSKNKAIGEQGVLTIINSGRNGKRVIFSQQLMIALHNPETVQLAFSKDTIYISSELDDNRAYFMINKSGKKGIIYSASLILQATTLLELDYDGRVSITFRDVEYVQNQGVTVACIKARTPKSAAISVKEKVVDKGDADLDVDIDEDADTDYLDD